MDYSELLTTRRSVRDYEDKQVPLEILIQIINESCLAPSPTNRQPWRFVVVTDRNVMGELSNESKRNRLREIERNRGLMHSRYEQRLRDPDFNVYYNAPCLVFVAGPKNLRSIETDCALAASYFMFSASNRGLATCWISMGRHISDPELLGRLGLSESDRIVAPLIIGYPKRIPPAPARTGPEILKII
ncbi:MAG: nitroreductase family protein [Thermoleophilia bacterium]